MRQLRVSYICTTLLISASEHLLVTGLKVAWDTIISPEKFFMLTLMLKLSSKDTIFFHSIKWQIALIEASA